VGFLQPILLPIETFLFEILKWLEGAVGDWGLAIILLTILVRVVLIPLTWKQTKSMYELQKIQPQLKAIQEKYKNDKEKQQEEVMKFYQEHKVNPFGGCLPLLLQMPIFFALFGVIGTAAPALLINYLEAQGEVANFLFIIPDISKTPQAMFMSQFEPTVAGFFGAVLYALPYLILVIMFALSVWLPQQLMPGEKQQKMIGSYMAVVMLYFGWVSPAGVLIYWVTSSIWGIGQQQLTMKLMDRQPALAPSESTTSKEPIEAKATSTTPKKQGGSSKSKSKKK